MLEPYAPCLIFTHTTLHWRISFLDLLVLTQYYPYNVTMGLSSRPPSSEATILLDGSHLSTSLFMTMLIHCWLLSSSSSFRAIYISLDPLSKSPRIETGRFILGSIRRAPSGPLCETGAGGRYFRRSPNLLSILEILMVLLE